MRALRTSIAAIALLITFCSCQSPTSGDAGVTLSPTNGSTDVLLDAEVSGTFTKAISEPQWSTVFTLTQSGQTTNLCTSYSYNSGAYKVVCAHDALANNTTYSVEIIPFIGCSGNHGSFTTVAAVSQVTKKMVVIEEGGLEAHAITFSFDPPLSFDLKPAVTIELPDGSIESVQGCTFEEERTALVCTVACPGAEEGFDCFATLGGEGIEETTLALSEIEEGE